MVLISYEVSAIIHGRYKTSPIIRRQGGIRLSLKVTHGKLHMCMRLLTFIHANLALARKWWLSWPIIIYINITPLIETSFDSTTNAHHYKGNPNVPFLCYSIILFAFTLNSHVVPVPAV